MASARSIAAWFPQTAPVICELAGVPASLVEDVRARYAGGEFQEAEEAARLLPDDFVRSVALAGDAEHARGGSRRSIDAGADSVHVFPLGANRMRTVEAFAACFSDVVGARRDDAAAWRVTALHHVAMAHGDDPVCEDALTMLLGRAGARRARTGVPRADVSGGRVLRADARGRRRRAWCSGSSTGAVRACTTWRSRSMRSTPRSPTSRRAASPLIDREARPGGMGTRVAFLHPSATGGVLVELVRKDAAGGDRTRWMTKRSGRSKRRTRSVFTGRHDRRKVTDWVCEEIREAIIDLRLPPGEPLREATIADAARREQDADPRGARPARAGRTRRDDLVQGRRRERVLAARPGGDLRAAEPPGRRGRPRRRGRARRRRRARELARGGRAQPRAPRCGRARPSWPVSWAAST